MHAAHACAGMHALRAGQSREWSDFPSEAPPRLTCTVVAGSAKGPATLLLRQDDVKRADWQVMLNGHPLGYLLADEHKQMRLFEIPASLLHTGDNELRFATNGKGTMDDDIRIDRIQIDPLPRAALLAAGKVHVRIADQRGKPLPARITVTDDQQTLLPVGAVSGGDLAVRTGTVYTASGDAEFTLPAGSHVLWASRGFEYSAAHKTLRIESGSTQRVELHIQREIEIPGWTAGDTHLHTVERSGHGDATVRERAITIAGEGIAWAASTEHNRPDTLPDLGSFLPIPGVEMTTAHGHFNLFPWPAGMSLPKPNAPWAELWDKLPHGDGIAVIWNHPRDNHSGYRAFDPSHYVELAAESLDVRVFPGNAMEVVNSGAMYSHPLRLAEDWMRHLNRGAQIAAVGSSDSHTVATFPAGQARTYVHTGDGRPTASTVANAFARGETAVSYGLAAFLDQRGDRLFARVYGPSWNRARRLLVYANAERVAELTIDGPARGGLQWQGEISPPALRHDAWLVVIATGSDQPPPYWPISRPYQPVTPDWSPMTLGISPAVRWDGNHDGRFETPRQQAEAILADPSGLATALAQHDAAVAAQAGFLLVREGRLAAFLTAEATYLPRSIRTTLEIVGAQYAAASAR